MGKGTVRAAIAAAVTAGLALAAAGCGGEDQAQQPVAPSPSATRSASPSPSPSPTPDPTPSAEPLSRFEDRAPVQAARRWARLYAKSINRGDRDLAAVQPVLTGYGRQTFPKLASEDIGLYYPGPMPFTPTGVEVNGRSADVVGCIWVDGFALNHKGGVPARKREIGPGALVLKKVNGKWKVHTLVQRDNSCKNVPVKGIGW